MAVAGSGSAIIAACRRSVANAAQMRSKRFANAFQVLGSSECGVSGFLFPKYPVEYSAGNYETFIGVDDGPYCRELGTARLVIRYESASRPVYLTPGNLECLPDIKFFLPPRPRRGALTSGTGPLGGLGRNLVTVFL